MSDHVNNDNFDIFIDELLSNRVPANTDSSNKWATRSFDRWLATSQFSDFETFENIPVSRLNYILELFLVGSIDNFRSKTMYQIIQGLNRNLKASCEDDDFELDLLKSKRFSHFRKVFDGWIKTKQSIEDAPAKKSGILSSQQQVDLTRTFNRDDPRSLLRAVVYFATKVLALRGGDELSTMTVGSITMARKDANYEIRYHEKKSKNKQPGLARINYQKKVVTHIEPASSRNSFSDYYLTFLTHCHPDVIKENSPTPLFQHPLKLGPRFTSNIWLVFFSSQIVNKQYSVHFQSHNMIPTYFNYFKNLVIICRLIQRYPRYI